MKLVPKYQNPKPDKGSVLLRDSLVNFISGYPKSVTDEL